MAQSLRGRPNRREQEIREYWARQWAEFDPRVDVLAVVDRQAGKVDVNVHQLVKTLKGDVLSDTELWHIYTIANGLIERMDIKEGEGSSEGPSEAFSRVTGGELGPNP